MEKDRALIRPIFKKLLIAAIVIYIIGSCIIHADVYSRLGEIEHKLVHVTCSHK